MQPRIFIQVAHPIYIIGLLTFSLISVPFTHASTSATQYEEEHPGEEVSFFINDHLGSVDVVLDEQGKVVERRDFLPYGEDREKELTEDAPKTEQQFNGKLLDDETGLYYYGARYYDPLLGRFTSADPWEGDLTNPQTLNKYSYVINNPVRYIDPTGKKVSDFQQYISKGEHYAFGETIGTYKGIEITSAAENTGEGWHQYQCTTLTKDYIKTSFGIELGGTGDGRAYGNQGALSGNFKNKNPDTPGDYTVYNNGGGMMPKEDDIISWTGGEWGHVGIIAEVTFDEKTGKGVVYSIEQNASPDDALFTQEFTRNNKDGKVSYTLEDRGGLKALGWARHEVPSEGFDFLKLVTPDYTNLYTPAPNPSIENPKKNEE